MDNIPTWIALVVSSTAAILIALLVQLIIVPWQRRKILGQSSSGKPVRFIFGDSDGKFYYTTMMGVGTNDLPFFMIIDSSANSSPKRTKRPISLVYENNTLPAITESTELQSLNSHPIGNNVPASNGAVPFDYYRVAQWNGSVPITALDGKHGNNKFDPHLIKKAENLISRARPHHNVVLTTSLDNTDLTITSLNYIDEYQHTINGRNLQNLYHREPENKWVYIIICIRNFCHN